MSVAREGDKYTFQLTDQQRSAIGSVLLFMRDRNESFSLVLQLGCVREFLDAICRQVAEKEEHGWSIAELHVIYAALSSIGNLFASEEDFYIRLGFFRENAVAMALSLAEAIAASEAQ